MLDPSAYVSGGAADHYRRYEEDFDIAQLLGHNAHRFSLEWSRIEPEEGRFDEAEIEHYRRVVHALRDRGMEPFVTLWHFSLPRWFEERGGWAAADAPRIFARYAERAAHALGGVRYWITINEPEVFLSGTCLKGTYPPGRRSMSSYPSSFLHLVRGHRAARDAILRAVPGAQAGIAKHIMPVIPFPVLGWWWNRKFLSFLRGAMDFVGVNYYRSLRFFTPKGSLVSDMGWNLAPSDTVHALREAARYGLPVYVTENGLADADDVLRESFIRETMDAVERAVDMGLDVRGYFHWSLLDNFEWDKGFWPRFGLVEVDYATQERRIRKSARALSADR